MISEKVLKMALLHDLAESEIGDYTPSDIPKEEKTKLEEDAFIKIMGHLPDSIKQSIWRSGKSTRQIIQMRQGFYTRLTS